VRSKPWKALKTIRGFAGSVVADPPLASVEQNARGRSGKANLPGLVLPNHS
jgi:hypothetical protein